MVPPEVEVDGATYRGVMRDDGEVAEFLGIPFAEPPVGERRWTAPVPVKDSRDRNATRHAAACMQGAHMVDWYRRLVGRFGADPDTFPVPGFSEDCLYLNVWTPALDENAGLPVMVWIHGGSHTGGWSYEPNYQGDSLARRGVVVVSIAYRLDIFGFFSHPDLEISNFGLLASWPRRWWGGNTNPRWAAVRTT
jgi:para-nitrobenzyl esterase